MSKLADIIISDAGGILKKVDLGVVQGKTILVTGASGLIGVYFLACLKQLAKSSHGGFNVVAVLRGDPPSFVKEMLGHEGANVIFGDLCDNVFCKSLPEADLIIHAAGYGQPGRFMENPEKTLKINTAAAFSLLEKLRPGGKFLFASTSEVYSGLSVPPFKETDIGTTNTMHPRACFIEAKRCGEAICNAYRAKGIDAKSARISLAYGPGTRRGDTRVINSFIQKALEGKIVLLDQGKAKRTYCYISDAIEIMWKILLFGREPIYNVAGFSRLTIGELAGKIGKYLNVPVIFPSDPRNMAGAPDDVYLDMTKVKNEFGKIEYMPFDEGLGRTIEWQKILYSKDVL